MKIMAFLAGIAVIILFVPVVYSGIEEMVKTIKEYFNE